ncbi:MAG TPA: class I SAM-dependent methyltransferase [Cytophagales bacterium]
MLRQERPAQPIQAPPSEAGRRPTPDQLRAFYDRLGPGQDSQAFYEEPAIREMVKRAGFREAHAVFEFGLGTGRLAEKLLGQWVPPHCLYQGVDFSPVMVELSRLRLAPWERQALVQRTDGGLTLPVAEGTYDRFVATYVLEILTDGQVGELLGEARRILTVDGALCLVNLTFGNGGLPKLVSSAWRWIHQVRPLWVGGCRPIRLKPYLADHGWRVVHYLPVTAFGITSEVIIARPR